MLDERWLQELLGDHRTQQPPASVGQSRTVGSAGERAASHGPQLNWDDALDVRSFYGRDAERALLAQWMVEESCRVVSVLGIDGVGKSALAITVMRRVAPHFDVVIWRSLRDAPACEALLDGCLQVLVPQAMRDTPGLLEGRLRLLIAQLRERRVLLPPTTFVGRDKELEMIGRLLAAPFACARQIRPSA